MASVSVPEFASRSLSNAEVEDVAAEAGHRPKPVRPPPLVAEVDAEAALADPVVPDRPDALSRLGRLEQADAEDLVVAEVGPDRGRPAPPREPLARDARAPVEPAVGLLELVALDRVVEESR